MSGQRARIVRILILVSALLWAAGLAIASYLSRTSTSAPPAVGEMPAFAFPFLELVDREGATIPDDALEPALLVPALQGVALTSASPAVVVLPVQNALLHGVGTAATLPRSVLVELNAEYDRPSFAGVPIDEVESIQAARESLLLFCRLNPRDFESCIWDVSIASWRVGMALFARSSATDTEEDAWMALAERSVRASHFVYATATGPRDRLDSMHRDMHEAGWRYATAYLTSSRVWRMLPDSDRYTCDTVPEHLDDANELFGAMQEDIFHPPEIHEAVRNLSIWIAGAATICAEEGEFDRAVELLERSDSFCRTLATMNIPLFSRYYEVGMLGPTEELERCVASSAYAWSFVAMESAGVPASPADVEERLDRIERARSITRSYATGAIPGVEMESDEWVSRSELQESAATADKAVTRFYSLIAAAILGLHIGVFLLVSLVGALVRQRSVA